MEVKAMGERVAVIGGGVAGLTAAYLLRGKYEVTLYEKDGRLGGNAHTISTRDGLSFDIAAAVFGKNSYANFHRLLKELNVETCNFNGGGVTWRNLDSRETAGIAWTWRGLRAQRFAMFAPGTFYAILKSFANMGRGKRLFEEGKLEGLSMREALKLLPPFDRDALRLHLFVLCLVSSMYYEDVMEGPASYFFGKMIAHRDFFLNPVFGLFQAAGNTKSYVDALASRSHAKVILNSRIKSVGRTEKGVTVRMDDGSGERFDKVIFACNADQALRLLEQPTADERRLLGAWRYQDGPIVVHKDRSSFPEQERYVLFTFLYTEREGKTHTSVNGHIRSLRSVPDDCPCISSQHPNFPIAPDLIEFKKVFRTPIYDRASVAAIRELPSLNGKLNTYYCGSHFGFGLHEDCVNSAAAAARMLGVEWGRA
jgi:predicted NAD/FAD-binding protein